MDFTGQQLRDARNNLGWDQPTAAKMTGVGLSTIGRLETIDGPVNCRAETIRKLLKGYNIPEQPASQTSSRLPSVLPITPLNLIEARLLAGWSREQLSANSQMSCAEIASFEQSWAHPIEIDREAITKLRSAFRYESIDFLAVPETDPVPRRRLVDGMIVAWATWIRLCHEAPEFVRGFREEPSDRTPRVRLLAPPREISPNSPLGSWAFLLNLFGPEEERWDDTRAPI